MQRAGARAEERREQAGPVPKITAPQRRVARREERASSRDFGFLTSSLETVLDTVGFAGWLMSGMPDEPVRRKPRTPRGTPGGSAATSPREDSSGGEGDLASEVQEQLDKIQAILARQRVREHSREERAAQRLSQRAWRDMEVEAGLTDEDVAQSDSDHSYSRDGTQSPGRRRRRGYNRQAVGGGGALGGATAAGSESAGSAPAAVEAAVVTEAAVAVAAGPTTSSEAGAEASSGAVGQQDVNVGEKQLQQVPAYPYLIQSVVN